MKGAGEQPLRLGLEAQYEPAWMAGLQYVRNIVYTLAALDPSERPLIRLLPLNERSVDEMSDLTRFERVELAAPTSRGYQSKARLLARRVLRRFVIARVGRPMVAAFKDLDATYPAWGRPIPGTVQIHWVPDLQHAFLPELFGEEERAQRDAWLRNLAHSSNTVVFSSRAALDDFGSLYPGYKAAAHVWRFVSPLTDRELDGADPRARYDLPAKYLYVGNQFWAHKDHMTLFRAIAMLRSNGLRPTVVCTGLFDDRRDPSYTDRLLRFLDDEGLTDQVKILGVVPRPDQIAILRYSTMVVQPSRFEGWSTLVEDAKGLGRPLILSDFRVHLEQAPDQTFFATGSAESLADAIETSYANAQPGPDPDAERRAGAVLHERRKELAHSFIAIVRSAMGDDPK